MSDRFERELLIPAPTQEVWEVVTGGAWLAEEVSLDLRPGGDASFRSGGEERSGWVEAVQVPEDGDGTGRLAFWWALPGEPVSRVELTLDPAGWAGSRLRVVETRPLEVLDLVGATVDGIGPSSGPVLLAA